jgi:hypothetical protein
LSLFYKINFQLKNISKFTNLKLTVMKRLSYYLLISITAMIIFTSCGKDGAVGPAGATGPQGAVGPAGPAGANGQNGSVIYSGTMAPPAATGAVGDFYLNTATGLLYGPKTASGWGTGFSLIGATGVAGATGAMGATGAAGVPGSKTYSGSGAPASTTGTVGDYYLDKTNYLLYGPKTASGWGSPINLQGPAGAQGPAGPQGPQGNANVMTDVFSVGGAQWLWNSQYVYETSSGSYTEYFTRYYVRLNTTITQNVLSDGLVLVYFQPSPVNNPNQWEPLPYQFDSSFGFTYNYVYVTAVGQVTLHYFFIQTNSTATLPTLSTYNDEVRQFKIVTITGTLIGVLHQQHINLNNYQEVSKATGLWQQDKLNR